MDLGYSTTLKINRKDSEKEEDGKENTEDVQKIEVSEPDIAENTDSPNDGGKVRTFND